MITSTGRRFTSDGRSFIPTERLKTRQAAKRMGRLADTGGFHVSKMITVGVYQVLCGLRSGATLDDLRMLVSDYVGITLSSRTISRNLKLLELLDVAHGSREWFGLERRKVWRSGRAAPSIDHEAATRSLAKLSGRQREILKQVAAGLSSAEIADQLGIATTSVDTHRSRIRKRLGLTTPDALMRFALLAFGREGGAA